jgi:Spy/CpxP family protein refolding chaperone
MKLIRQIFLTLLLTFHAGAEPADDFLFPPELIARGQAEIKLTDEQLQRFREATEKVEARARELGARMKKENDAFAALLKPSQVDAVAALAQLDKLLEAEREMKHAQIAFMLTIKNNLTPEQQAKLTAFRKTQGLDRATMEEFQKRFVVKAERVRIGMKLMESNGGDLRPIAAVMEEVHTLMDQGKPKEAEAAIDRALKLLNDGK